MRVVWVVGGNDKVRFVLTEALAKERTGIDYLVRIANSPAELPAEHYHHPGVIALVDSFHPAFAGLQGLRELRRLGFQGPIFLFGEPAPESAVEAFRSLKLNGYFPPFERADFYYAAGLIHYQLHLEKELNLKPFLSAHGRASSEMITSLKDFNQFTAKLSNFVGRFGIDLALLKKVLMGLSLAHVKTTSGAPRIDQPFQLFYGMDPAKVLLAAPTFSKGSTHEVLLKEFTDALLGMKTVPMHHANLYPEIFHVARSAENLVVLSGSSKSPVEAMDPMFLMASIAFPPVSGVKNAPVYSFAFSHVKETTEPTEEFAKLPVGSRLAKDKDKEFVGEHIEHETSSGGTGKVASPAGTIEAIDIDKILAEPQLFGDQPKVAALSEPSVHEEENDPHSATEAGVLDLSSDSVQLSNGQISELEKEIAQLKELNKIMGQDIRRLMRERREPTTDRELRDAKTQLDQKVRGLSDEKKKLMQQLELKDAQIESLKKQLEEAKKNAA